MASQYSFLVFWASASTLLRTGSRTIISNSMYLYVTGSGLGTSVNIAKEKPVARSLVIVFCSSQHLTHLDQWFTISICYYLCNRHWLDTTVMRFKDLYWSLQLGKNFSHYTANWEMELSGCRENGLWWYIGTTYYQCSALVLDFLVMWISMASFRPSYCRSGFPICTQKRPVCVCVCNYTLHILFYFISVYG